MLDQFHPITLGIPQRLSSEMKSPVLSRSIVITVFRGVLSPSQISLRHHSCILSTLDNLWVDLSSSRSVKKGEENMTLKCWGYLKRKRRLVASVPTPIVLEVILPCPNSPFPRIQIFIPLSCWEYWWLMDLTWGPEALFLAQGHTTFWAAASIDWLMGKKEEPGSWSHSLAPLQLKTTMIGLLSSRAPRRVSWGLCCKWIAVPLFAQFL